MIHKSRTIPVNEFFELLQLEYIAYYVRYATYPDKYKEKYLRNCEGKKKTINGISTSRWKYEQNIFNNNQIKKAYFDKFFNLYGLPNFIYADEKIEKMMSKWDALYYFGEGGEVHAHVSGELSNVTDVIVSNLFDIKMVDIDIDQIGLVRLKYNEISKPYDINLF